MLSNTWAHLNNKRKNETPLCKRTASTQRSGEEGLVQGKPGDPIPVSCSHVSLSSAAPNLFPPGSSTLVLSLIKEQYVAGLTCQIFK